MKLVLVGFGLLIVGFVLLLVAAMFASPGGKGTGTTARPSAVAEPAGPSLLPEVRTWFAEHAEFGSPVSSEDQPDWARGKRQAVTTSEGVRLLLTLGDGGVMTAWDTTPGHDRVIVWGEQSTPERPGGRRKNAEPDGNEIIDGLSVEKRKEIYGLLFLGGSRATKEAERRYPMGNLPTDSEEIAAYLKKRRDVYEASSKKARADLMRRFKVDSDTLDRLDTEGGKKDWPAAQ